MTIQLDRERPAAAPETDQPQTNPQVAPTALEILNAELANPRYSMVNHYPLLERPAILNHRDLLARARRHLIERALANITRKLKLIPGHNLQNNFKF